MGRLSVLCILWSVVAAADELSFSLCANITPQSPTVELGRNLTAFCILDKDCLRELGHPITASELFWKVGTTLLHDSHYTVINDSVSSVTFEPTLSMHNSLTCSFKAFGQTEVTLHGIYFNLGHPPEKPTNLSCICNDMKTLTCTWEPGRDTKIPTTYTLRQFWVRPDLIKKAEMVQNPTPSIYPQLERPSASRVETEKVSCVAKPGDKFCTLNYPDFILYIDTTFLVEAVNDLGTAQSDHITFDIINIVKPSPPDIVSASAVLQGVLRMEWKNPVENFRTKNLKYNIRYRINSSSEWSEVPENDLINTRNSFTLQELEPYTVYVLTIRCQLISKKDSDWISRGFWSEWSKEYTAITLETTPSRAPEFWRKIYKTDSEEKRIIQLMWKNLQSGANGKILGYNVTIKRGPEVVGSYTLTDTTYNITVSKDAFEIVLTAYNHLGSSPPSILVIPPVNDKVVQPHDMKFKVFSQDGRLWVEWTPSSTALGYVIEWCSNSQSMDCNREWQRESSNTGRTFLRGDIKPFVYYLIRLNVLQRDGQERSATLETYLEQGVPEFGPKVNTQSCGKTRATLVWDPVPLPKRRGFITNYTIKYEANSGPSKVITVNATDTEYTLESLTGKTTYRVTMTVNTDKGGKDGPQSGFTTSEFDKGEIEAIVVPSCLGFLMFILVLCFVFCNKKEQIKKHLWPNVPDPSKSNIAQWSPQTPSRHESKPHPFQDGPFTDVSVVEITAADKKDGSDADLKSVDNIKKNTSEGLSSGIGGSSCLSSPQLSVSDSDGISSAQNTSSTVQYSTVIMGGYQGQTPMFSRSESTQPLLVSEERPDDLQQVSEEEVDTPPPSQYFKQSFSPETAGRIQESVLTAPAQDLAAQILHLAGFSHGQDSLDLKARQDINPNSPTQVDVLSDEQKTYLPQNVRQGGYLPQ